MTTLVSLHDEQGAVIGRVTIPDDYVKSAHWECNIHVTYDPDIVNPVSVIRVSVRRDPPPKGT